MEHRLGAMREFANELEWTPSYEIETPITEPFVRDHLVVEHGLENSAVISFVRSPYRTNQLDLAQLRRVLGLSYNNLIEWHLLVSSSEVRCINNLSPSTDQIDFFDYSNLHDRLSGARIESKLFNRAIKKAHSPCDDIFIDVISRWKRLLKADYGDRISNANLSALFNAVIFARACEDFHSLQRAEYERHHLLAALDDTGEGPVDLLATITGTLKAVGFSDALSSFVDAGLLAPFRNFDIATAHDFLRDFYRPSAAPYDFNFAWMSKHALSRIYERYVSLLEFEDTDQLSFLAATPTERAATKLGAVYTPQFIAGFFARYLSDNMTPRSFRTLAAIDPACGSGIFVRTLLEQRCNVLVPGTTKEAMLQAFQDTVAIDRDPNAVAATKLSLTLLHLVATGEIPRGLPVMQANAISLALEGMFQDRKFGAVLANPPYIKLDHLSTDDRNAFKLYVGQDTPGRVDSYLAFVRLCLEIADPNGFVCLVLPQVFLLAENAKFLRQRIATEFDVRCIVDLTSVPVFEAVGTYNVLAIFQRRAETSLGRSPTAQVARVKEFVGPALQACLDRRSTSNSYYETFEVDQSFFRRDKWVLLSSIDTILDTKLGEFRRIETYLEAKQGFLSGADDIFIRRREVVPGAERAVYIDYLPDRAIQRYSLPSKVDVVVFYPFEDGLPLTDRDIRDRYPKTWAYLQTHKKTLSDRRSVISGDTPWWRPVRPRDPKNLLRPKIVCPHLMLAPRFAVDRKGQFAVSHAPFLISRSDDRDVTDLRFFCAVLNSSVVQWYLQTHAPKYGRGYNRVEVSLIREVPVPDPSLVPSGRLNEIIDLTDRLAKRNWSRDDNSKLDTIISELYGLTPSERDAIVGPQ